jgi:FtsH-binding integral membrane protein
VVSSIRFYFAANLALLLVLAGGFSRTFYLRPMFSARPLPLFLYVHGAVLTLWFVLAALQAWLVQTGRLRRHRRNGYVVAGFAALVAAMGLAADRRLGAEIKSPHDGDIIVFWGNLFSLVLFATFVAVAVGLRKHAEAHKRLMLLASFSIAGPALARFADWSPGGPAARPLYGIAGLLLLFGSLIAYDVVERRRPHAMTAIGLVAILATLGSALLLGLSGWGFRLLHGA